MTISKNKLLSRKARQHEAKAKECFENESYSNAIAHFKQALKIRKQLQGEQHPDFLRSLEFLSDIYADLEMFDNATNLIIWGLSPEGEEPFTIESIGDTNPDARKQLAAAVIADLLPDTDKAA